MLQNLFTGLIPPLGSLCLVALQIVYRGSAPFGPFLLKLNLDSSAFARRGGCAVIKCREASLFRADGVVKEDANAFRNIFVNRPPRPLHQRWLRNIFLMSRPPLLTRRGLFAGFTHFV